MKEYIKEELNTLREYLRTAFLFVLAILTGIVTNVYQVISHTKPLYSLIFSVIGFVFFAVLLLIIRMIILSIIDKTNQLKEIK